MLRSFRLRSLFFAFGVFLCRSFGDRSWAEFGQFGDFWQRDGVASERAQHFAVWTGTEMIVWGGEQTTSQGHPIAFLNTGGRFNPMRNSWTAMSTVHAPSGRQLGTGIWTGRELVVWGGIDKDLHYVNNGARYDAVKDVWTPVSTNNAPSRRGYHTGVWTGSEMLIWGGTDVSTGSPQLLRNGADYDPVRDTWRPISTASAPEARWSHVAVWTGNEMLVWGGWGFDRGLVTGGRYDPKSDSWRPMTTVGAPGGISRGYFTGVWTGTELIIWGRMNADEAGGRYNPATDKWRPVASSTTTPLLASHTAVWTGTEMLVWGGMDARWREQTYLTVTNAGGRYNPVTDQWTPIPMENAPSRRSGHSAIWTGTEMLIWGGGLTERHTIYNPGEMPIASDQAWNYSDGGRFDPAKATWTKLETKSMPEARAFHTALWTGNEMLIWGGFSSVKSGRRYDPITSQWTPIADAPSLGTVGHSAVWTGDEMILWGGLYVDESVRG